MADIDEVIQLAKAGPLLVGGSMPAGVAVVSDPNIARALAWEATSGDDELSWTDVREHAMAAVKARLYGDSTAASSRDAVHAKSKILLLWVRKGLPEASADLLDDVFADLQNCAVAAAVGFDPEGFFSRIWDVYRSGGWPCGWEGTYPSGRLVAWNPVGGR